MNKVKHALTRKFGPFPAWGWAIIVFGAVYFYRKRFGGGSARQNAIQADLGQTSPMPPQPPIPLSPGESVYDPNTGQLVGPGNQTQPIPITINIPGQTSTQHGTHHHRHQHRKPPIKIGRPKKHKGKHRARSAATIHPNSGSSNRHRHHKPKHRARARTGQPPNTTKGTTRPRVSGGASVLAATAHRTPITHRTAVAASKAPAHHPQPHRHPVRHRKHR